MPTAFVRRVGAAAADLVTDAGGTSWVLIKILIPISIVTRILEQLGVVAWLGDLLGPVMALVGLPGSMGLVWATAIVTNLYGGMVVFASLAPEANLTVAQVTVLTTMMLLAHCMPVELRIAQKAGVRAWVLAVLRLGSALGLGLALRGFYAATGLLQRPVRVLLAAGTQDGSWAGWLQGQIRTLCAIFLIVLVLLLVLRTLKWLGITDLLTRLLEPVLTTLGMSPHAAPMAIIGMTLGMAYVGGLILRETASGRLSARDVFSAFALLSLCHSIIEDTLLMAALGAHVSGTLVARLLFAFVAIALLARGLRRLPDRSFSRFLFASPDPKTA